jgi:TRAP-type C4-dicarboxylate transport system permease small subunit
MSSKADKVFLCIGKLNYFLRWFGVGCLLFLTALIVKEVFMRCVFDEPSGITVELGRTLQIYLGFMCAGYVQSIKAHLNMEDLLDYVGPKKKKLALILGSLMGAGFCGIMAYESWDMVFHSIRTSEVTLMLEWPMYLVKGPTFVGFVLLGAQFITDGWMYWRDVKDAKSSVDLSS